MTVPSGEAREELFTLQIQGKGLQIKARIPGWMVAAIFRFVKESS